METLQELKAKAFDLIVTLEETQAELRKVNEKIALAKVEEK